MDDVHGHSYDAPGTYHVYLRVSAIDMGLFPGVMYGFDYIDIHVYEPGSALAANADAGDFGGYEGMRDYSIQLFGAATGGTPPYSYEWDFGDNKRPSDEQNPNHIYTDAGTYTVTLTVTDNAGDSATDTAEVTVAAPDVVVANAGGPYSCALGDAVFFSGSATGGIKPYTYEWNFGDGTPAIAGRTPMHVYEAEGTYAVTLTVTDSEGTTDEHIVTVIITEEQTPVTIQNIKGGLGFSATISSGSYTIDWSIDIDGRFVFGSTSCSGSLGANSAQTVRTPLAFGLGRVDITVTAGAIVEEYSAFMLGPFILGVN
jgi:PKD repeat protein